MNNSIKNRILLGLKCFIVVFPVGLLLQLIIKNNEFNTLKFLLITLAFSVGASINDVFIIIFKKSHNEMSEKERSSCSFLSLFLGILSIPSFPLVIPSILGIIYAVPVLKSSKNKIALTGVVLSSVGLLLAVILYTSILYAQMMKR